MRGSSHVHLLSSHTQRYKQANENKTEDEEEKKNKQTAKFSFLQQSYNKKPKEAAALCY